MEKADIAITDFRTYISGKPILRNAGENMNNKKLHLKKAEENLVAGLRAGETDDEQIKAKILKAISEVQKALELIGQREKNKYHHDSGEDEDMWVG